jgi:hypothetical protein
VFGRLKKTLVESFVGAIALGFLLAQAVTHVAYIFTAPLASWVVRTEYASFRKEITVSFPELLLKDSLLELIRSICLLLLWYVLFWWLYLKAPAANEAAPGSSAVDFDENASDRHGPV